MKLGIYTNMIRKKEQKKSKFNTCPSCSTNTTLLLCPNCKTYMGSAKIETKKKRSKRKKDGKEEIQS